MLALLLALLVAAGACGLACNSMTGLAALAGIGGGGLIIAFLVWAVRRIWGPRSGRKRKSPEVTDPTLARGTYRI
jgi:hypothetical protein